MISVSKTQALGPHRMASRGWRRHRMLLFFSSVLCFLGLLGLFTLPLTRYLYNVQELDWAVRHPPSFVPVVPMESYEAAFPRPLKFGKVGLSLISKASSWLGHDDLGRSLLFRLLPGFLVSLCIGLLAAFVAIVVGVSWGSMAALAGGRTDAFLMRFVDVLYGLPYVLMVILLKIALTPLLAGLALRWGINARAADIVVLFLAIGGVSWLTMARVVRGQVLSLKSLGFVDAARVAGAGPIHILRHHLLPNILGPVAVYATLVVPQAILQEAFLSFLGIGIQQPTPSLGRLAADGVQAVNTFVGYWWLIVYPSGLLVLTLLSLNFIGDGLRDWLDPKSSTPPPL